MGWPGVSQAASFQLGPSSKLVPTRTFHVRNSKTRRRNTLRYTLLASCVADFHNSLVRHIILPDMCPLDGVILAIDVEGWEETSKIQTPRYIGIAALDTTVLFDPSIPSSRKISTKLFHRTSLRTPHRRKRQHGKYLFSDRERFSAHTVQDVLGNIFAQHSGRNVILVGQDIQSDLHSLASMEFEPEEHACITHILDTQRIAGVWTTYRNRKGRRHHGGLSLEKLCKQLGFEGKQYHNAANDANFTLRALLLLLGRAVTNAGGEGEKTRLLREIAMTPFPTRASPGRLEHMHPENAAANRLKKQALRAAIAEWDEDLSVCAGLLELSVDPDVA